MGHKSKAKMKLEGSAAFRNPVLGLALSVLKQAVVDAQHGDPGAWIYLESEQARDICELTGFDTRALKRFVDDELVEQAGKAARKHEKGWRLYEVKK